MEEKIRINSANSEEISRLFGIGTRLAQRVITCREKQGYFHGPDDLAQVKGISKQLATIISANIDWTIPEVSENKVDKTLFAITTFVFLVIVGLLAITIVIIWPNVNFNPENQKQRINSAIALVQMVAILLTPFVIGLLFYGLALNDQAKRFSLRKYATWGAIVILFMNGLAPIIGFVLRYQLDRTDNWARESLVLVFDMAIISVMIFFPMFYGFFHPEVLKKVWLARVFDFSILFIFLPAAVLLTLSVKLFQVMILAWPVIVGIGLTSVSSGIRQIKKKEDGLFLELAKMGVSNYLDLNSENRWVRWLNIQLPNPKDQQELRSALDKIHPPSRTRTVLGIIFITIGGWVILSAVNSILDWIVQGWLNKLFPFFK